MKEDFKRTCQEFYCTKSGGGCGGYIVVKLSVAFSGIVKVICPKCGHDHQRNVVNGHIKEQGRHRVSGKPNIEIMPVMAAYSKKPQHVDSAKMRGNERDSKVFQGSSDAIRGTFMADRWCEKAATEKGA